MKLRLIALAGAVALVMSGCAPPPGGPETDRSDTTEGIKTNSDRNDEIRAYQVTLVDGSVVNCVAIGWHQGGIDCDFPQEVDSTLE